MYTKKSENHYVHLLILTVLDIRWLVPLLFFPPYFPVCSSPALCCLALAELVSLYVRRKWREKKSTEGTKHQEPLYREQRCQKPEKPITLRDISLIKRRIKTFGSAPRRMELGRIPLAAVPVSYAFFFFFFADAPEASADTVIFRNHGKSQPPRDTPRIRK